MDSRYAVMLIVSASAACDGGVVDDAIVSPTSSSGVATSGAGGGPIAPSGTLTVRVGIELPSPGLDSWIRRDIAKEPPAVGATVALDTAGGERIELVTGADGSVTFEGIDWDAGRAAVTAYLPGHALASRVGIASDGEVPLYLRSLQAPGGLVKVSGTAGNMTNEAHYLEVSASVTNDMWWGDGPAGPSWSIRVVPNTPFTIVAREIMYGGGDGFFDNPVFGWVTVDHPAVTSPTTVDLDFGKPASPTTVSGSFDIALRADSPLRSGTFGFVYSATMESRLTATVGRGTSAQYSADGNRCDYVVEYVELPGGSDPVTLYRILHLSGYYFVADVLVAGYPGRGPQTLAFIDVPRITSPTSAHLHDQVSWESFDADVYARLQIASGYQIVWTVESATDDTTLAVPQPPSTVDVASVLGAGSLKGYLKLIRDDAATDYIDALTGADVPLFLSQ